MRSIYFASTSGTYEDIYCSILQAWVIENFIIAVRSLCILEAFASYGNLLLKWTDDSKKSDVENTDDDGTHKNTALCKRRRNGNAENGDTPDDQQMNDDGRQHEDDDNTADQHESTGHGDDGDDGDDDDDDDSDDGSGYDDEDYEEEEEESDDTSFEDDMDDDPLLTHAREVYAPNYFRIFEREYRRSMALHIDVTCEEREVFEYKVNRSGDYSRKYKVTAQWFGGIVSCSCNYFSITGFLCSHCLAALPCLHVDKIADCYLLKWQMKGFSSDQILRSSSLPRAADDSTKVSRDTSNLSLYETLYVDDNCTDVDYIVAPLLRNAKEIYLPEIYDLFREEYNRSELLSSLPVHTDLNERGIIVVYQVDTMHLSENYMVYSEPANATVNCTCQRFAATGILCRHALLVLYVMDVVKIPSQYINPGHAKGCYDVGNDNNGKIHGPRYAYFEKFARWRVKGKRVGLLTKLASKCGAVGFDSDFMEGCLGELSKGESSSKEEEEGGGDSVKSPKSEILFWDDQGIKSFTYKKPVMTRKLYLNCRMFTRYSP